MTAQQDRVIAAASFLALLLTIVGANWALERFGIIPVGFGLMAPAGVLFAGLAFGLRDVLHEAGGRAWVGQRRMGTALEFGCHSCDGTYLVHGPDTNLPKLLRKLRNAHAQPSLFGPVDD